jgi:prepilin-type N-terminal cleavage/methylation domain-containing protein
MRTPNSPNGGFTLIEIMIVVAIIGLLAAIAVPNFLKMRTEAQKRACLTNLERMDSAKQLWGLETGKTDGDLAAQSDIVPTYLKAMPGCPSAGTYEFRAIGEKPTCTAPGHTL